MEESHVHHRDPSESSVGITGALAAAAGLAAGRLGGAPAVRAADGDPLILGATNEATGFTVLNNTSPGVQALTITVPGGGVGLRAESESGEGVFGTSNGGNGVWGHNTGGGNGVTGTSDTGNAVAGNTFSGVALLGEVGGGGSGLALNALGPVHFSTSLIATIPQGQSSVTVAPVIGEDELPLDLTEQTKVLCTLLGNAGTGRVIWYVSIDPATDTFTVHLPLPARVSVPVACFVLN